MSNLKPTRTIRGGKHPTYTYDVCYLLKKLTRKGQLNYLKNLHVVNSKGLNG